MNLLISCDSSCSSTMVWFGFFEEICKILKKAIKKYFNNKSSLFNCTFKNHVNMLIFFFKIDLVWFLWHINLCRLFNAKAVLLEEQ